MNIYIIDENLDRMGGVEKMVSIIANHFSSNPNNNVTVISILGDNNPFFTYSNNVNRNYLSCNNKTVKKIKSYKIKYLYLINDFRNLCKKINDNDVIIFGRIPVAAKLLPFIKSSPKIIVRDAINLYDYSKIVKKLIKKYFPKKVSRLIVSSNESLQLYNDFFDDRKNMKIEKIYNPLDDKFVNYKFKYNFDNKLIVSNGRFDTQKGFDILLKSFKIVLNDRKNWKLKIIGDGPLKKDLENYIKDNNLDKNVFLEKSSNNICDLMSKASLFVLPSRFEGYANSLVEAMALGIPCISFNWLTGVEEIISNGKNGEIVTLKDRLGYYNGLTYQEDVLSLANTISSLIENKEKCLLYNKESKNIVKSRKCDVILKKWEKIVYE